MTAEDDREHPQMNKKVLRTQRDALTCFIFEDVGLMPYYASMMFRLITVKRSAAYFSSKQRKDCCWLHRSETGAGSF